MITEKKGKTTVYKCGKRYETSAGTVDEIFTTTGKKISEEIRPVYEKYKAIKELEELEENETVTEPESIPDKKNKKKTLKEG